MHDRTEDRTAAPPPDLHAGFADVDRMDSPDPLVTFLDHLEVIPEFVAYKADLRRGLALRPGDVVLDVGCGIGTHAIRIAAEHDGQVIGLDRESMLSPARERSGAAGGVRWLAGDAERIALPDDSVDACLVERVLKHLPDPAAAMAEIRRVLRPGGRVGVFELDYRSTVLDGDPAVADAVHTCCAAAWPNPAWADSSRPCSAPPGSSTSPRARSPAWSRGRSTR